MKHANGHKVLLTIREASHNLKAKQLLVKSLTQATTRRSVCWWLEDDEEDDDEGRRCTVMWRQVSLWGLQVGVAASKMSVVVIDRCRWLWLTDVGVVWDDEGGVTQACAPPRTRSDIRARQTLAQRRPRPTGGNRKSLTLRHSEYIMLRSVMCDLVTCQFSASF